MNQNPKVENQLPSVIQALSPSVVLSQIEYKSAALAYIAQLQSKQSQQTVARVLSRMVRLFCEITKIQIDENIKKIDQNHYLLKKSIPGEK